MNALYIYANFFLAEEVEVVSGTGNTVKEAIDDVCIILIKWIVWYGIIMMV